MAAARSRLEAPNHPPRMIRVRSIRHLGVSLRPLGRLWGPLGRPEGLLGTTPDISLAKAGQKKPHSCTHVIESYSVEAQQFGCQRLGWPRARREAMC